MDASKWEYIGEGGEHAIFGQRDYDQRLKQKDSLLFGTPSLLRIRKRDLAASSIWTERNLRDNVASDKKSNQTFIRKIIADIMIPYVDIPKVLPMEWNFLKELHKSAISSGRIPSARVADWKARDRDFSGTPTATLLRDYRRLNENYLYTFPSTNNNSVRLLPNRCIAIELKPKAGILACSPLVHPLHRAKFQKSRFVLLQNLHKQGKIAKGWAKASISSQQVSLYDPLDLYSMNSSRMRTAISNLFDRPQNNLKVFYNGSIMIGHGIEGKEYENVQKEMYSNIFQIMDTAETKNNNYIRQEIEKKLGDWITTILLHENILQRLLELQKLDILDADGAILVYQRFVELCDGSHEKAQRILDDYTLQKMPTAPTYNESSRSQMLDSSPFYSILEPGSDISVIDSICDDIATFSLDLKTMNQESLSSKQKMDDMYTQVISKVKQLTTTECEFLLLNWLLSLTMCDASIFITIQQLEGIGNTDFVPMGDKDIPGLFTSQRNGQKTLFIYSLRLIDCDGKPARKLKTREQKESVFQLV